MQRPSLGFVGTIAGNRPTRGIKRKRLLLASAKQQSAGLSRDERQTFQGCRAGPVVSVWRRSGLEQSWTAVAAVSMRRIVPPRAQGHAAGDTDAQHIHPAFVKIEQV